MSKKVLIIDDDEIVTKVVSKGLAKHGYEPLVSNHPAEGFKLALQERPDLIILDVLMPVITGYELSKLIKESKELARTPIIIMSSKQSMGQYRDDFDVFCFVQKGDFENLLSQVASAFESMVGTVDDFEETKKSQEDVKRLDSVVLVGMDNYVIDKLKNFLRDKKVDTYLAADDKDAINYIYDSKPRLVLAQFWEERDTFDAVSICKAVEEMARMKAMDFLCFCDASVSIDATRELGPDRVMVFKDSKDLMQKVSLALPKYLPS